MSGYKKVSFHDQCRLCISSDGIRTNIFSKDGRNKHLAITLQRCLPLKIKESDLPKTICSNCVKKLDEIDDFRNQCVVVEKMLQDFRSKLLNMSGNKIKELDVYVKDTSQNSGNVFKTSSKRKKSTSHTIESENQSLLTFQLAPESTAVKTGVAITLQSLLCGKQLLVPSEGSVSLRLNTHSLSIPINVENVSSLMKEVYDEDSIYQLSKFNLSTVITPINTMNMNKIPTPSTSLPGLPYESSATTISLILSPNNIRPEDNVPSILQVDLTKKETNIQSMCSNCRNILNQGEICLGVIESHELPTNNHVKDSNIQADSDISVIDQIQNWRLNKNGANFSCDVCTKPFKKREHLLQHKKLHLGIRPYACSSCGKSFSRKEHLYRHTLAYTGEKQHWCSLCGKTFSRKDNLHKHKRTHGIIHCKKGPDERIQAITYAV